MKDDRARDWIPTRAGLWVPAGGPSLAEGWFALAGAGATAFEREAAVEIGPGHELSDHALKAVAGCLGCDDVAFQVDDGRFAVIHLTWARHRERPGFPFSVLYGGYQELEAMAAQHAREHAAEA